MNVSMNVSFILWLVLNLVLCGWLAFAIQNLREVRRERREYERRRRSQ